MSNKHLLQRLSGLNKVLLASYEASIEVSSATKGSEREIFISQFLERIYPSIYRFGSGDVIDSFGEKSGQLDVVIEHPFGPSLPLGSSHTRLYLAETVAAVLEVKSNIAQQWNEVVSSAQKLSVITPILGSDAIEREKKPFIPFFAVGFNGWKTEVPVFDKLAECRPITGVLMLDHEPIYASLTHTNGKKYYKGSNALWAFICELQNSLTSVQQAYPDYFSYQSVRAKLPDSMFEEK